ncbi:hypothetical protein M8J77_022841 [Diaphorina citri]|nr:hypothetical protein M8J77_022841 [Diaphorina citri]
MFRLPTEVKSINHFISSQFRMELHKVTESSITIKMSYILCFTLFDFSRYLPVLKNVPTRYIHEPWMAPLSVQKASKCVVGVDYPLPMVNHPVVSKINIERIKQVYRQLANYKGNKKCVKPKSPEAMTIEAYASQVTPPSLACTDANSPLPSPVTPHAGDLSPQVINTDVIQYPPCCYNEQTGGYEKVGMGSGGYSQYTTGQTEWDGGKSRKPGPGQGKGKTIHQGGGKPMAVSDGKQMPCPPQISGKPINQGGGKPMNISQMGGGKPMNMSQIGGKPMSVSSIGGKPVNISQMRGKPMNASQMGGKPMNTSQIGGKPMAVSYMGGKPMDISQMGGKPMSSQISGKPMSSQMGGKPMNTSQIGGKPLSVSRGKPMSQLSQQMKPPPTTMDDQLNSDYLDITQVHLTNQMSPDYPMPRADLTKSCADSNIRYADGTMSNGDGTMACADSNIRYADGTMANDMTNGDGTDENSYTDGPMSCADGNMSCSDSNIRFADPNMSNGDGTDETITYADGNMSYSDGNMSCADGNMSCADSNAMCSDMGSMDPPQSTPRGRMSYGAMVGARETEEQMLNEESTVIEIADSIITESEEREKMK